MDRVTDTLRDVIVDLEHRFWEASTDPEFYRAHVLPDAVMVFDLVAKFASYGFNKSHAAAYALVAYQTAYLKANHPVEFLAASMTLDSGNTDKLNEFRPAGDYPADQAEEVAVRHALAGVLHEQRIGPGGRGGHPQPPLHRRVRVPGPAEPLRQ